MFFNHANLREWFGADLRYEKNRLGRVRGDPKIAKFNDNPFVIRDYNIDRDL